MRLRDYLEVARERLVVVVAVVVLTMVSVVGLLLLQKPDYAASVRLRARPPAPGSQASDIVASQQFQTDLGTEAELVRSSQVAALVAQTLNIPGDPDNLLKRVSVVFIPDTAIMIISATDPQERGAVAMANTFANKYLEFRRRSLGETLDAESKVQTQLLRDRLSRLQALDKVIATSTEGSAQHGAAQAERDQQIADLVGIRSRLDAIADRAAIAAGFGEVIQPAKTASANRSQSVPRAAVFGLLLGVPLALAAALVLDGLSNDVRTRQDAERAARADLLGTVPLDPAWNDPATPRLVTAIDPLASPAQAYRTLGYTLARYAQMAGAETLLFTSPGAGDGKTVTVANLAVAFADSGRPVRVIDADLRHPRLASFFGTAVSAGVADVLAGEVEVDDVLVELGYGLEFVGSGRQSERPDLLVARGDFEPLFHGGRAPARTPGRPMRPRSNGMSGPVASLVLLDSPGVVDAAEVSSLAMKVDAVVLVARARSTSKQSLAAAAEQVRQVGGAVLGVVLIGLRTVAETGQVDEPNLPNLAQVRRPAPSVN